MYLNSLQVGWLKRFTEVGMPIHNSPRFTESGGITDMYGIHTQQT